jgi:molybdate transport system substrate-binding protein
VLLDYKIDHIAIANPETAPYGKAALEYLQNKGYYDLMYDKLVYGSNISHSNQFVYSGAAAIGFSSKSVVYSPKINKAAWMPIDPTLYAPIEQGVLVIKNEAFKTQAEAFHAFLFSAKGKEILTNFGYELP